MSLSDTKEKSNGSKLSRLLIDGGTEVLRSTFDSIHSPTTLSGKLNLNLLVLNDLRRKRVLNKSQWDKLFPPAGVPPESKNFDITLLFILLRNICGLSPPSTGWDKLPPATDTTLEANFARIKYFRNEVYGHISSTSIEDSLFESFWKDISSALVALGLEQINVDLLKSEPIGSTDYIKLLEKWTDEEGAVKEVANRAREAALIAAAEAHETRRNTEKIIESVQSLQTESTELKSSSVPSMCSKLAKYEFTGLVESLCGYRFPGTREWILEKIQHHISNEEKQVTVITARPGVGKSVIAALTCQAMKEKDKLAACHFIEHSNSLRNTPKHIVESLASHLCESIDGFKEKLEEKLSRNKKEELNNMNCNELFTLLVEEPLNAVRKPPETALIVIDALDEIDQSTKDGFVKALFRVAPKLPKWIKLVVTTRPMPNVIPNMHYVTVIDIEKCCNNNKEDINLYLFSHLQKSYCEESREELNRATWTLCNISNGIFLFAHFAVKIIEEKKPCLSQVDKLVPIDISTVYEEYVNRLIKDLPIEENIFFRFLEALVASGGRLPKSMAFEVLRINGLSRRERKIALRTLSHLFPVYDRHFTVFHKSFIDWLLGSDEEQHDFVVKPNDGHRVLAPLCFQQLQFVKSHENFPSALNESENYALRKGFDHMLRAGGFEKELKICLNDLELLSSMLYVWSEIDLLFFLLKKVINNWKLSLPYLEELIETQLKVGLSWFGEDQTQLLFQVAIFCSEENELRKQAVHLLRTPKYHHISCIEFTDGGWELPSNLLYYIFDLKCALDRKIALCVGETSNDEFFIATFNTESRTCITFYVITERPYSCAISSAASLPDAAVTTHQGVKLIDLETLQTLHVIKTESKPVVCCFLSQGAQLAVGYADCTVRIWDIRSLKLKTTLIGHTDYIKICLPLQGNRLLTGDKKGTVLLWQSLEPDPQFVKMIDSCCEERLPEYTVSVSPDQTKIAVLYCPDYFVSVVKLYSADDGNMLMQLYEGDGLGDRLSFIDNSHILFTRISKLTIMNTDSREERKLKRWHWSLSLFGSPSRINISELEFVAFFRYLDSSYSYGKLMGFKLHNVV